MFFCTIPICRTSFQQKLIDEFLQIDQIFVLHQPRKEADIQNWVANTRQVCERAKDGLPKPIFPEVGEWYFI